MSVAPTLDGKGCIGSLEPHLHELFSSVRVPGEEFVYSASNEMYNQLDDYCDETTMHEVRPPMLIMDESGSGKSSLLANWLHRRKQKATHARKTSSSEFVFWHAVGCTRQSMNVHSLIRRLMHDLKAKFDITRDVPFAQDRLSWELPRFFEMAAKKGKLIVVIDGIHRLVTNEDTEAGLAWLPLEFPPNMRIIISATAKRMDLASRGILQVNKGIPRENSLVGSNVDASLVGHEKSRLSGGVDEAVDNSTALAKAERWGKILSELERRKWKSIRIKSLDKAQCRNILETYIWKGVQSETISMTTGPFLTAEPMAVNESSNNLGFLLFDTQVGRLLTHAHGGEPNFLRLILRSLHYATRRGFSLWYLLDDWLQADSVDQLIVRILRTIEEGYTPTKERKQQDESLTECAGGVHALRLMYHWHPSFQEMTVADKHDNFLGSVDNTSKDASHAGAAHAAHEDTILSERVKENLGDQQWLALGGYAESVLEDTKTAITTSIQAIMEEMGDPGQKSDHHDFTKPTMMSINSVNANPMEQIESLMKLLDGHQANKKNEKVKRDKRKKTESALKSAMSETKSSEGADEGASAASGASGKHSSAVTESQGGDSVIGSQSDRGLDLLPTYMLGGMDVSGLGSILGNALALLYVARHGLMESEIWGLLASLHETELTAIAHGQQSSTTSGVIHDSSVYKEIQMHDLELEAVLKVCYSARGEIEDLCRAEDLGQTGLITQRALEVVLNRLHKDLSGEDVKRLLTATGTYFEENHLLVTKNNIDYCDLIRSVVALVEKSNEASKASKSAKSSNKDGNGRSGSGKDRRGSSTTGATEEAARAGRSRHTSLGPVLEESLLAVLIALGVLHLPDKKVLVLPSDSEAIRKVVYEDYVRGRGGEAVWHGHLIKHFQRESNSMRRCEELPWHLQICRKWHTMKDCLVDLDTFEMMYDSSDLRDEFMAYWVTLTEGPMFVTDESHRSAMVARQKQAEEALGSDRRDPELSRVLMELDMAAALGLSEKGARTMLLENQVSCFDVNEEFNRSVEAWVSHNRPTVTQINAKLLHIARFLAEFSKKCSQQPNFLRLNLKMDVLTLFGINFDILKDLDHSLEDDQVVDIFGKTSADDKDRQVFPSGKQLSGNFSCYLRWMWVQFPWLALQRTLDVGSILEVGGLSSVLATVAAGSGKVKVPVGSITEDEIGDSKTMTKAAKNAAAVARSTRLWDVKKSDPSVPLFIASQSRKNASIKSSLLPDKVTDVMDMSINRIRDDIANASAARTKMPPKFRRSMDQELEAMKDVPHSEHCKRSMTRGTLFPSLDKSIKEKNEEAMGNDKKYSAALLAMRRGGPGLTLDKDLDATLKELAEAEQMKAWNDRRGGALPIGSEKELDYEREFERTVKLRGIANKMTSLRRQRAATHEELSKEVGAREAADEEMAAFMLSGEAAIEQLKEKLQSMTNALDEGQRLNNGYKLLIEMLSYNPPYTEKHVQLQQQQLDLARQQLADLMKLRHNMYLEAERDNKIKRKEIMTKIQYFKEATANLRDKMDKIAVVHEEHVIPQSSHTGSKKHHHTRGSVSQSGTHGTNVTDSSVADTVDSNDSMTRLDAEAEAERKRKEEEEHLLATETPKERMKRLRKERETKFVPVTEFKYDSDSLKMGVLSYFRPSEETREEADKQARKAQSKMMYDFLMDKTGSTSDEELIERFMGSKKLTETLLQQQTSVDSRLAQLRVTYEDLKSGTSAGDKGPLLEEEEEDEEEETHDARFFESKLFEEDMHVSSVQRQLESSINKINEVRSGVTHVMNLLTVNHKMLHNLPKSKPPSVNDSVIKCLSWCEERILAINEAQMVDTSKPKGSGSTNEEAKSLFTRQVELAEAIEAMAPSGNNLAPAGLAAKLRESQERKAPGNMSEILISTGEDAPKLNLPRTAKVKQLRGRDAMNDNRVEELQKKRDADAERFEREQAESRRGGSAAGVTKFLSEALSTKESSELLRKANLRSGKVGRHAGLGYVLEEYTTENGISVGQTESEEGAAEEEKQ